MITKQWLVANQLYHEEVGGYEETVSNFQPGNTFSCEISFRKKFTSNTTYSLIVTPVSTNAGNEVYIEKKVDGSGAIIKSYNRNTSTVIQQLSFNWIAIGY